MKKRFFSLQYKFLIYFLLLSILSSVVTGVFCYIQTSRVIVQKATELYAQQLEAVASNINAVMLQVNQVSHLILQNNDLRRYFDNADFIADENKLLNFLLPFTGYNSSIQSVCIQGRDGGVLSIGRNYDLPLGELSDFARADELDGRYFWQRKVVPFSSLNRQPQPVFSFIRQYRDMYNLSNHLGYIRIDIRESEITKLYSDQTAEQNIFLMTDEDARVIYASEPSLLGAQLDLPLLSSVVDKGDVPIVTMLGTHTLDRRHLSICKPISSSGGYVLSLVPLDVVVRDNTVVATVILSVVAVNIVLCFMLSSFISHRQFAPLRSLSQLISQARHQNFQEYVGVTSNDEIGILATEFNNMSQHLERMINTVYAAEIKQKEAEFSALQAQINPHFLYNTLDTIYWLARLEKANESAELVRILGELFRLSLNKGSGITTVENEVNHLSCYLLIQRKRHQQAITVSLDVAPETMIAKTVKLVLQPLVENAFLHGVSSLQSNGTISVTVSRQQNNLVYQICDNGVGITTEQVHLLLTENKSSGLGIKNVHERIQLLFGEQYGVFIESLPGHGTTVTVVQPFTPYNEEAKEAAPHDTPDGC